MATKTIGQVYKQNVEISPKEYLEVYAVDESSHEDFIDLKLLFPYQDYGSEFFVEGGFDAEERVKVIRDMMEGLVLGLDVLDRGRESFNFKFHYESDLNKTTNETGRILLHEQYLTRINKAMCLNILPEYISKSLLQKNREIAVELLHKNQIPNKSKFGKDAFRFIISKMTDKIITLV
ncbi:hypothetical protein Q73A0000_05150 [Kaistella flava (ex Peng et al. 2021)]|uniref:Uncharacterized protein n=1 Tax=Kaistella flava (ex Peng et al. 2021) TaxID=2038776 RepID=A0A7M2Y6C2_9FLAO|nr:hypothetical protein [Kaistella flava (ex Peng et al. 2021)]QOW09797.1 hypothetical protein Q73A0000_05150 [Kaistella flava (ex Peng et al. 2021)]